MTKPDLIYTTYIRTTPEKLWNAITNPEFARQYWGGNENVSDWKPGSKWSHVTGDKERAVRVIGKVWAVIPPTTSAPIRAANAQKSLPLKSRSK